MKKTLKQSRTNAYYNILKYHGPIRGLRRILDQITQLDLYDLRYGTNFAEILSGDDFYAHVTQTNQAAIMHYQPVYTAAIRQPLKYLTDNYPILSAPSACFMDLGCGRGKSLHVAGSTHQHLTLLGVDISQMLLMDAAINLGWKDSIPPCGEQVFTTSLRGHSAQARLVCSDVNDVNYNDLLAPYDVVVAFNKNSFGRKTTQNTAKKIRRASAGKSLYYIYSNPVLEEVFANDTCIFVMRGWHKNWNTKVFQMS